ncbi:SLC13 family permease [Alkalicoccus halolimnae]|uniref:Sodium-dependent dicarboxylate transporter SdcS n=1 Tax=Alkalicoccus halolimnae TaxID=1667239 RepID=A0A5C7F4B8_9BACI|nr:SLC13 family permease [Alkalicoccus halolimnae]TXF85472.1 hypothetical protein FTX54_07705 [Alkalicoccus halolimnae]
MSSDDLWTEKKQTDKNTYIFIAASLFFLFLLFFFHYLHIPWQANAALSILFYSLILWALEPVPFGMTSLITLLLLLLLQAASMDTVFSGFASPAVFLIIAGIMIAKGVNETRLLDRITYFLLSKSGGSPGLLFVIIFLLIQVQALFIPAASVRITLILPIVLMVISYVNTSRQSNFNRLMLVGTAYAGNISGMGVLTAGVANILTVEMLAVYHGSTLNYFQWLVYAFPLWTGASVFVILFLLWFYPPEKMDLSGLQKDMKKKRLEMGKLDAAEVKCICILLLAVALWMTEPFHGLHPVFPALAAAVLMGLPGSGFTSWQRLVQIDFDLIILIGATLSLGFALIESGAVEIVTEIVTTDWVVQLASSTWVMVLMVIVLTQFYHLIVTNINTAVVTMVPFLISFSHQLGHDPIMIVFISSVSTLFGFVLVVQTIPNVLVYNTGLIRAREFIAPGIGASIITMVLTGLVAFTYWRGVQFWP